MHSPTSSLPLSERASAVLKCLVEHYLRTGEPVGSRTLSQEDALSISPATVRSILGELEAAGYLQSPHISAGRVPTDLGLRLFVEHLMTVQPSRAARLRLLQEQLVEQRSASPGSFLKAATKLLAKMTQLVGIASFPKPREELVLMGERNLFRHVHSANIEKIRALVEVLEVEAPLVSLLNQCFTHDTLHVFIGQGEEGLAQSSVIAKSCVVGGEVVGILGVIGPTRIAYDEVVSWVETTTEVVSGALSL